LTVLRVCRHSNCFCSSSSRATQKNGSPSSGVHRSPPRGCLGVRLLPPGSDQVPLSTERDGGPRGTRVASCWVARWRVCVTHFPVRLAAEGTGPTMGRLGSRGPPSVSGPCFGASCLFAGPGARGPLSALPPRGLAAGRFLERGGFPPAFPLRPGAGSPAALPWSPLSSLPGGFSSGPLPPGRGGRASPKAWVHKDEAKIGLEICRLLDV